MQRRKTALDAAPPSPKSPTNEQPALPARRFCRRRSCIRGSFRAAPSRSHLRQPGKCLPTPCWGVHGGEQGACTPRPPGCKEGLCLSSLTLKPLPAAPAHLGGGGSASPCPWVLPQHGAANTPGYPAASPAVPRDRQSPAGAVTHNGQLFSEARSRFYSSALLKTLKPFGCCGCFMSRASKDAAPQAGPSPARTWWGAVEKPFLAEPAPQPGCSSDRLIEMPDFWVGTP